MPRVFHCQNGRRRPGRSIARCQVAERFSLTNWLLTAIEFRAPPTPATRPSQAAPAPSAILTPLTPVYQAGTPLASLVRDKGSGSRTGRQTGRADQAGRTSTRPNQAEKKIRKKIPRWLDII